MKSVIIFGSKYGSARKYAMTLSEKLNLDVYDYSKITMDEEYDLILYVGSLYAGGVLGLKQFLKRTNGCNLKKMFIITVGISDPNNIKNIRNLENNVYKQLPKNLDKEVELFHVRGKLDYSQLSLKHKIMMKLLYHHAKKIPFEKQDEETRLFISTYNKKVDFIDLNSLEVIIDRYVKIKNLMEIG